jgi:hypothetical protein
MVLDSLAWPRGRAQLSEDRLLYSLAIGPTFLPAEIAEGLPAKLGQRGVIQVVCWAEGF